jgi:malate dehydrogenase (oxaloacetate-decarboxylating)
LHGKKDQLTPAQIPYAREDKEWEGKEHGDLLSVVKEVRPHVLIGTSTKPGAFTEDVVREMAKHVDRPVIFPLSNPTRLHEAKPQDLYDWTDGKVLVATGSPFPPVKHNGNEYDICEFSNPQSQSQSMNILTTPQLNATIPSLSPESVSVPYSAAPAS